MVKTHIVIDSTTCIDKELLAKYPHIHVVSLKVMLGNEEYLEYNLSPQELFAKIEATGLHPTTSQPAPADFINIFEKLRQEGKEIVVISVSGGLSGTVQGARSAAAMVDKDAIFVIDSQTASIGIVQQTIEAAELANKGLGAKEIAEVVQKMADNTFTMLVPGTLEYLRKGGRIGGAAALVGTILQIRPVLYLQEGKVAVLDKVRTRSKALNRMIDQTKDMKDIEYIGIAYYDSEDDVAKMRETVKIMHPAVPIKMGTAGSSMASHLGPGVIGFIVQKKLT